MKMYARMSVLLAGVLVLGYSFTANPVRGSATQGRSSKEDTKKRAQSYDRACARCHGSNGRGETSMGARMGVPDFTAPAWKKTASGKRLIFVVTSGHEGMPAFKDTFTKEEIKDLVTYVRNFQR
jgi:mono/diheme cytochrome c family protein